MTRRTTSRNWRRNAPLDVPRRTSLRPMPFAELNDRGAQGGRSSTTLRAGSWSRNIVPRRGDVGRYRGPRRRVRLGPAGHGHVSSIHCERWSRGCGAGRLRRAIDSFRATAGDRIVHYVVADVTGGPTRRGQTDVEVVQLEPGTGWGAARNAGLKRRRGRVVVAVDGSIEADGRRARRRSRPRWRTRRSASAGPFGIVTPDLREFDGTDGPEVDAIEGYFMAFRREILDDGRAVRREVPLVPDRGHRVLVPREGSGAARRGRSRARRAPRAPDVVPDAAGGPGAVVQAELLPVPRSLPGPVRPDRLGEAPARRAPRGGTTRISGPESVRTAGLGTSGRAAVRGAASRSCSAGGFPFGERRPGSGMGCVPSTYACRSCRRSPRRRSAAPTAGPAARGALRIVVGAIVGLVHQPGDLLVDELGGVSEICGRVEHGARGPSWPNATGPSFWLMPYSTIIARAMSVARCRSFGAPVESSPNTISSADAAAERERQPVLQLGLGGR